MLFNPEGEPSVFDKLLAPFLGKQREQLEQITGQKYEKSAEEKRMQRSLGVASLNMGIAGMSLLYPPLIWLAIPGVINKMRTFGPASMLSFLNIASQEGIRRHASVARQRWALAGAFR